MDGESALPVELEHASVEEGGVRYNVVFNGLAWRPWGQEASESIPRQFEVLVYSFFISEELHACLNLRVRFR